MLIHTASGSAGGCGTLFKLQKVLDSTAGMYGEMQGIIGISMPEIESLDLKALAPGDGGDEEEGEIVL